MQSPVNKSYSRDIALHKNKQVMVMIDQYNQFMK